ncbi:MAG: ParB/RepB/Spo0J family partition protein [Bacteroidetes bacterium]|nr:ParB/RepB/Spo0J family partition protein [Bacteroidota bacterium]
MAKKKAALGRGLSALLENAETDITSREIRPVGSVSQVLLNEVEANPFQPRVDFGIAELEELASSIRVHGVIQPITVRKMGYDKYQLISGERRTRAAILAGLTKIPAYIRVANDQEMLEMALIENIQRADLNAIEVAMSYKRLLDECSLKQEELGERVGKDRTTVNNYLRLLKLPVEIQSGIKEAKISMGHARAMINMDDMAEQLGLYNQIIEENLSVRAVETLVKEKKSGQRENFDIKGTDWNPDVDRICEAFGKKLSASVHMKHNHNGRGKVIISYRNLEDLERILALIP